MSNQTNRENTIARLLGETSERKLILFEGHDGEAIGNFNIVRKTAQSIKDNSADYTTSLENLGVTVNDNNLNLSFVDSSTDEFVTMPFGGSGLDGLCRLTEGPTTGYIRKCMSEEKFDLAERNINEWLGLLPKQDRKLLIRTTDERVHGILSNKYTKFDDHEVLEVVDGILSPYRNYTVKNYSVTPDNMRVRIIGDDKMDFGGRELSFGYEISNSRVGRGCARINVIIFDWICSNGMIFGGGKGLMYAKSHIASNREEFITEFVDMLDKSPDAIEYIKRNIDVAQSKKLDSETIQKYLDKFRLESAGNLNLAGKVKDMMESKYSNTLWGLTGAITEVAQGYEIDTRIKMETFAGNILAIA